MASFPRVSRWLDDPLIRWLIIVAIVLVLLHTALWLFFSPRQVIVVFTWFAPTIYSFFVLATASIAFLCLGRYQVLRQPAPFWIGVALSIAAVVSIFILLTLPGLVSTQQGLIAQLANTSGWISSLYIILLPITLQVAIFARWPQAGAIGEHWWAWLWVASILVIASIASLSIVFEQFLPILVVDGAYDPLYLGILSFAMVVHAMGAMLAARRYLQSSDLLFWYLSLTELMFTFTYLNFVTGLVRYNLPWYLALSFLIAGSGVMLFGLLSEYVGLYRRERQRTRELEGLQQVTDPSLARLGLEPLLISLLERMVAIMGANAGAILLLDPDKQELVIRAAVGIPTDQYLGYQVRVGEDFAGRVVSKKSTLWVRDAQTNPTVTSPYIKANHIRGILGVPMSIGGEIIGVVHVDFLVARDFGRLDEQLLEVVAERAALAIYQARLLEDAQRRAGELDAIITSIADGVLTYSLTGEIVRMNPAAERILRYSEQERKRPMAERLATLGVETAEGKHVALEDEPFVRALRGETIHNKELSIHPSEDGWIWLSLSTAPIRRSDGEMLGAVVTLTDITKRKQAERERERLLEKVQEERSRLQVVLDTAPVGIAFYAAPDGALQLMNKAVEAILGRPSPQKLGVAGIAAYYDIHLPNGEPFPPEQLSVARSLRGEAVVGVEELILHPSGRKVFIQVSSAPLFDDKRRIIGAIVAFLDITRIKEQELLRDEFISAAAHELKTPTSIIKGYAQLMRRRQPKDQRQSEAIEIIDTQTDRINRRVQEMLEAVRFRENPPEYHRERFDLGELASEVVERMQAMTQEYHLILKRDGAVPVEADRERIEDVMVSLVDNAIKFSLKSGDIEVRVRTKKGEGLVSVQDHGVGIAKERQAYIFEPFYEPVPSGAPGYHGIVALGLYLSKLIIDRHGGRIWLESKVGQGSTFYFALPLVKGAGDGREAQDG